MEEIEKKIFKYIKQRNLNKILILKSDFTFFHALKSVIIKLIENKEDESLKFILNIHFKEENMVIRMHSLFYCVKENYLDFAYYILNNYPINISYKSNFLFRISLKHKQLEFAKYLYENFEVNPNDADFRAVEMCFENHMNTDNHFIFEWLWNLPKIQSNMKELYPELFYKIYNTIKFNNF